MKIIVYDDNPDFGGHQIMACHGIGALAADSSIDLLCMIHPDNERFMSRLNEADIPLCSTRERWPAASTDLLLCIQGDITQSTRGLKTANRKGIRCVSYLALPHSMAEMGGKLGLFRDRIFHKNINRPDRFITISDCMKQKLISRGCSRPVDVVPNGINMPAEPCRPHGTGMPSQCSIGLAGRIEFKQKQQDFIVKSMKNHPAAFQDFRLLIAGSGPDEEALRDMISEADNISFMPWQQDMDAFYSQLDLLVIPSRYEGVPLVMLEALARGLPVVASAVDGMKEMLPEKWTFSPGNAEAFVRTLNAVRETWIHDIAALQQQVMEYHSLESFKSNFVRAVCRH